MTEATTASEPSLARPQRWGIGDALLGWLVVQLVSGVWAVGVVAASGHAGEAFDDLPLSVVAVAQLGLALAFFGVPYLVTRLKGNGLVADLGVRASWSDIWRGGIPGVLLQIPVLPLLYAPLLDILDKSARELEGPARSLSDRADSLGGVVLLILIVGVLAPVFEEIFYRGLVQRSLLKRGLPPWLAIGITSVVFGVSHLEALQLPGLVLAGAVFGVLAHRAGRLGPAIAAHVAFNMVTVVALLAA